MENLQEYSILLSTKQVIIFKEIIKKSLQKPDFLESHEDYQQFLLDQLYQNPYPTLQIIENISKKSETVQNLIYKFFKKILDDFKFEKENEILLFLNFLTNFDLSDDYIYENLLPKLYENGKKFQFKLYLSLIARNNARLVKGYMEIEQKYSSSFSMKSILWKAVNENRHIITGTIQKINSNCAIMTSLEEIPEFLRNTFILVKLINQLNKRKNCSNNLDEFMSSRKIIHFIRKDGLKNEIQKLFYYDLSRISNIVEYLSRFFKNSIEISTFMDTNDILKLILRHVDVSLTSYEEIKAVVDRNSEFLHLMQINYDNNAELQYLSYIFVLLTVFDVITMNSRIPNYEQQIDDKISLITTMLREIKHFDIINNLMIDIFKMLFLRWEHLNCTQKLEISNRFVSSGTDLDTTNLSAGLISTDRYGFICRAKSLKSILEFLKCLGLKQLHSEEYKNSDEKLREQFSIILENINIALWKLSLLTKNLNRNNHLNEFVLNTNDLIYLVQPHLDSHDKFSSDDESIERRHSSISRRRSKVKRKMHTAMVASMQSEHILTSTMRTADIGDNIQINHKHVKNLCYNASHDNNIIGKMLGSPENLLAVAIIVEDFDEAKRIIQKFNLENTELAKEFNFLENLKQIKQKLQIIYDKYEKQLEHSFHITTTIEQIKNIAAIGFESTKITNVIEKFIHLNQIHQSVDVKNLLEKHLQNYPYLKQYIGTTVNIVNIFDIILNSSSFNSDICYNILNMSEKLFGTNTSLIQEIKLYKGIGVFCFFKNLIDCQRLYKNSSTIQFYENVNIKEILTETCYSLRPDTLQLELEHEKCFLKLYNLSNENDYDNLNNLKLLANEFDAMKSKINYFQRYLMYITRFYKLLKLKDRTCEYTITEILTFNPNQIIGELIFNKNMPPLEIETIVTSLNINFIHVVALNICPELCDPNRSDYYPKVINEENFAENDTNKKYQSIFNYIKSNNVLLGYLLQKIKGYSDCNEQSLNVLYFERAFDLRITYLINEMYDKKNNALAVLISDNFDYKNLQQNQFDCWSLIEICQIFHENHQKENILNDIKNNAIISCVKDANNGNISSSPSEEEHVEKNPFGLLQLIDDIILRSNLILENLYKINDSDLAKHLIQCTTTHKDYRKLITKNSQIQLSNALQQIEIFTVIADKLGLKIWTKVYDFGVKCPDWIVKKLLNLNEYKLCYKWVQLMMQNLNEFFLNKQKQLLALLLQYLMEIRSDTANINLYLLKVIEIFPKNDILKLYDENLHKFRNITLLNYIINYLLSNFNPEESTIEECPSNCLNKISVYKNYRISLKIFENLTFNEQDDNWNLLSMPLLLIEYLIMNLKFEILSKSMKSIQSYLDEEKDNCDFCSDKFSQSYDIYSKISAKKADNNLTDSVNKPTLASTSTYLPYIPMNLSYYQKNHTPIRECVDSLLRIYAAKSLDYYINEITVSSSSEKVSQSTDLASLDSLYGVFVMPKVPPIRENWIKDEDATHCMCCRRTLFTMLMRRHHCRRCGRVICSACSTNRMKIPELYDDVLVRACNDCIKQTDALNAKILQTAQSTLKSDTDTVTFGLDATQNSTETKTKTSQWQLSGKLSHDQLLREEFCFEHAPSVGLCLTILSFHKNDQKYIEFLLYHCRKFEKLLRPNPEVDYALVAKMINCLALAAKFRGGPPEMDTFRDHSEIILSIVQNGCENFLPNEAINNQSLRKVCDALITAEKWDLALDICLKCGFQKTGVMAAHGLACLKAGCYETAREKFSYCMPRLCMETDVSSILEIIIDNNEVYELQEVNLKNISIIKRPNRSPPLLQEIINIIECISRNSPQPEALNRANIIRNSNTSLSSNRLKWKDNVPIYEPAINILNTLSNLKKITQGNYGDHKPVTDNYEYHEKFVSKTYFNFFEESLQYLLTYASHSDIIKFLIKHKQLSSALKYFLYQSPISELFTQNIYLKYLQIGKVEELIKEMLEIDDRLLIWKDHIISTCRYLETKSLFNSLYQLQILLKDPIRASMTCLKFYSMGCTSFQELENNTIHLKNAKKHLESELELHQWENINVEKKQHQKVTENVSSLMTSSTFSLTSLSSSSFLMTMEPKRLKALINTIYYQIEIAKFLGDCERDEMLLNRMKLIIKEIRTDFIGVPTLFTSVSERIQICILILLCGKNIEEGFKLTHRIINNYKLQAFKVFGPTVKYLSRNNRLNEVEKLINFIKNSNLNDAINCDEIISIAVQSSLNNNETEVKSLLDKLIQKISSTEMKISCYIYVGQLKSAYLLANKYERLSDIRRILRQAEVLNQMHVKKLCQKRLNISPP